MLKCFERARRNHGGATMRMRGCEQFEHANKMSRNICNAIVFADWACEENVATSVVNNSNMRTCAP